ncbi:MAG: type III-A CRISPR-associated protein Cas10/Csm1 [Bacteroidales bacterium]|jgi:CRISPR-associated protein Csm1|nr:type III-A CRISPR-associated protein Cas10/Csm1 [Bacteroidales bacterium]
MINKEREKLYLASLLHDIGKFYQRADTGSVQSSKYLKEFAKVESTFCPMFNSKYSHKHVLWTAQFIDDYKSIFQSITDYDISNIQNKDNLMMIASEHHLSKSQLSFLGQIVKEADCLSSGMDRDSDQAYKDSQDENSWDNFKKKRMTSILQTVLQVPQENTYWHLPIDKMTLSKDYFAKSSFDGNPNYEALWKEFNNEFKFIQSNDYKVFSETLYNLLFKYTTTIPSSTINFADVSLFDHLKTTAAIAICLYDYYQSINESKTTNNTNYKQKPFILIGGDFSGIQKYIYQIVSKYAAKNLKGRSFYLRLLSDCIVRYILNELDLFDANIIYNSGGSFYILAPNTQEVKDKLENCINTIEEKFFEKHKTALYVAIDYIEVSKGSLMNNKEYKNLSDTWEELFDKRDKKKQAKFASIINKDYKAFFEPLENEDLENKYRDSITGEAFDLNEKTYKEGDLRLKEITYQQIELGEQLRNTSLMIISNNKIPYWKSDVFFIQPLDLGFYYYFANDSNIKNLEESLKASIDMVDIVTFNGKDGNCDFMNTVNGTNNIFSLEFYGGNEHVGKHVPSFEDLLKDDGTFKRLGVLRMDVDNLGKIFQSGINKERATLSRYAALSRSFDYFFSGYLNTIWKEDKYREHSLIIYSGGDDLFIVGDWSAMIDMAERISKDFKEYTCENKNFSISGGVSLLNVKYPIMKGAEEAAIAEDTAKEHYVGDKDSNNKKEKNSFSFLLMPLNWEEEYPYVKILKDKLVELNYEDKLDSSFRSKILQHYANADIKGHKITNLKTYWMISYDLGRMKQRYKKEEDVKNIIDNCISEVCGNKKILNGNALDTNYHTLELWAMASRWAELEIRTKNNINKKL